MPTPSDNFWEPEPAALPPATAELVIAAQNYFGVRLPQLYLDLIAIKNGGRTLDFGFSTIGLGLTGTHVEFDCMNGIGSTFPKPPDYYDFDEDSILMTPYMTKGWQLPDRQILLAGDGHTWISLDYRKSELPSVAWLDVEMEEYATLATSFESFVAQLRPIADFLPKE